MAAQNSAGIQTLLDAEQKAAHIVQKAREFRAKRIKEARDEARKEIEEYRAAKEAEFKKFEAEHTQGNKAAEKEANVKADEQIKQIQVAGQKNQGRVMKDLLAAVLDVNPVDLSKA